MTAARRRRRTRPSYRSRTHGPAARHFRAPPPSAILRAVPESYPQIMVKMLNSCSDQSPARTAALPGRPRCPAGNSWQRSLILGCANGLGSRIIRSVNLLGWTDALSITFGTSVIVWLSCIAGISIILGDRSEGVRSADIAVGVGFLFLVILPIGPLSWLAVTSLCLYILVSTHDPSLRRGAIILFATTVPMFWSRMLFQFFANWILGVDASVVGWLLGTHRTGNMVEFADGSGLLVIQPACSSLANVSLAFLCWVTVSRFVRHQKSAYDVFWSLLACAAVVAVNVTRMSLMGLNHLQYDEIHNHWGDAVESILFGLTVGVCVLGVRREPRALRWSVAILVPLTSPGRRDPYNPDDLEGSLYSLSATASALS